MSYTSLYLSVVGLLAAILLLFLLDGLGRVSTRFLRTRRSRAQKLTNQETIASWGAARAALAGPGGPDRQGTAVYPLVPIRCRYGHLHTCAGEPVACAYGPYDWKVTEDA